MRSDQVLAFVRSPAPEPRKRVRLALRSLESERGDIRTLEGPLSGYSRLRAGSYRIVFVYETSSGKPTCTRCLFAEHRGVVYTVFSHMLKADVLGLKEE